MRQCKRWISLFIFSLVPVGAWADVDFARDIRPILAENCFACHGPDEETREADLRLDLEDAAKESAVKQGAPADSPLVARITSDDDDTRMPPPDSGKSLEPEQIDLLKKWIEEGAPWSSHWAFERIVAPEVPQVRDGKLPNNEIDRFVLSGLEQARVAISPPADRRTLIRRLYLDLIGLPPDFKKVKSFAEDASDVAYERLVDELLESEHYGERMAIDWLDGARYADTNGFQNDFYRTQWLWRDWVINSFNRNQPYDQFVIEQIAGDLLPDADESQVIATGFNRNNHAVTEAGSIEEEWFIENVIDRVETTSTVFLGLTMGCARCHSHKYDPISQEDFYSFFAFFNNVDEKGVYTETRGNVGPQVTVLSDENKRKLAEFDARIAAAERQIEEFDANKRAHMRAFRRKILNSRGTSPTQQKGHIFRTVRIDLGEAGDPAKPDSVASASGLFGPAFLFNGKAGRTVGQDYDFQVGQPFSWSAWIYPEEGDGAIYSKMDDAAASRGTDTILVNGGKLKFHLVDEWPKNAIAVETVMPVRFGQWQHVAVTYDGSGKASGVRIYVGGETVSVKTVNDTLDEKSSVKTSEPLRLGSRSGSLFFKGKISRFAIDSSNLTAELIAESRSRDLYAMQKAVNLKSQLAPESGNNPEQSQAVADYVVGLLQGEQQAKLAIARDELKRYRKESVPTVMVMKDRDETRPTYMLNRGRYDAPDKSRDLKAAVPAFLPPLPDDAPRNRLGLARWLVSRDNPLVARVIVNRVWARFFGRGIVASLDNFGVQSVPPTRPELLDWLAVDLMENGWDLKRLQKQIVMSRVYRQSSALRPDLAKIDPDNNLLARASRFRLPAELIRDNALAISGLLSAGIGGPSVRPYQPEGLWQELAGGANDGPYKIDGPEGLYRRSLYTYRKRTVSHPTLSTFDAPNWETCSVQRARTNTPLQALALLNDVTYVEAGRKLAERMLLETGDAPGRVIWAYSLATGRAPDQKRVDVFVAALRRYRKHFEDHPDEAIEYLATGVSRANERVHKTELAAYALVASTILNLDEVITRE